MQFFQSGRLRFGRHQRLSNVPQLLVVTAIDANGSEVIYREGAGVLWSECANIYIVAGMTNTNAQQREKIKQNR